MPGDKPLVKIGILTFHRTINFGAILQAYALKTTVEKIAANQRIEIIDYVPKFRSPADPPKLPKLSLNKPLIGIKNFLRFFWGIILYYNLASIKKRKKFENFREFYLNVSKINYKKRDDFSDYMIVISGSDQVWNTELTKNDSIYYLDLPDTVFKISYAASFGRDRLTSTEKIFVKQFVSQIDKISVRELSAVDCIYKTISRKAEHVLDPTLLLNDRDWRGLCSNMPKEIDEPYLLIYALQYPEALFSIANNIAKKNKLKVVEVGSSMLRKKFQKVDYLNTSAGPVEFVSLFLNADFIVTNSFHGLAFSINFKKEFICYPPDKRATRMISLLDILDIKGHLIELDSANRNINYQPLNYQEISEKLDIEREKSLKFLKRALRNE